MTLVFIVATAIVLALLVWSTKNNLWLCPECKRRGIYIYTDKDYCPQCDYEPKKKEDASVEN